MIAIFWNQKRNLIFTSPQPRRGIQYRISGSGGIRTHASEETGALNQRLRPLGHATFNLMPPDTFVNLQRGLSMLAGRRCRLRNSSVTSGLLSSVVEHWSRKPGVVSSILTRGNVLNLLFLVFRSRCALSNVPHVHVGLWRNG